MELIISVISVVAIVFFLLLALKKGNQVKALVEAQRVKRNGEQAGTGFVFDHRGDKVGVVYAPVRHIKKISFLSVQIPITSEKDVKVRVLKNNFTNMAYREFGKGASVKVNNPDFDKGFIIETDNDVFALELLDHDIQNAFLQLAPLSPYLEICRSAFVYFYAQQMQPPLPLVIQVTYLHRTPKTEQELDQMIDLALSILDKLK